MFAIAASQQSRGTGTSRTRLGRALLLCFFGLLFLAAPAQGATFTATLDRPSVNVGESATLSLNFSGGQPDALPSLPNLNGLRIISLGTSSQTTIVNGRFSSTYSHNFSLIPTQAGEYTIPSLSVRVDGQILTSQAVKLVAVKPGSSAGNAAEPLALMKLVPSKTNVYVGEAFVLELQVFLRDGIVNAEEVLRYFDAFNGNPLKSEGFSVTRTAHRERRRAQIGTSPYTVSTVVVALSALKPGRLDLNSLEVDATLHLPVSGGRRADPFDAFGGFFGPRTQPHRVVLAAEPVPVQANEVPAQGAPPSYNGAIGRFELAVAASPTNVSVGDPITLKITISGQGALDTLAAPQPQGWTQFKLYPPSSKLDSTDPLQLTGARIFEQVISPESPDLKEIPAVQFSYFDPEGRQYRTLTGPALPIAVKPVGAAPLPSASVVQAQTPAAPRTRDIVHIKVRPGQAVSPRPILFTPWFLGLQAVPVLAFLAAIFWRKRQDAFARNPRLRRQQQVDKLIADGLKDLPAVASGGKAEPFFAAVVRLLQERLGERLDLPAAAITEAVIDSHLRPRGTPEPTLAELQELFQAANAARYAPVRDQQELNAFIPRVEKTLEDLARL